MISLRLRCKGSVIAMTALLSAVVFVFIFELNNLTPLDDGLRF